MPRYEERKRPIATWLTRTEKEHFEAIARANNVSPAAFLHAIIVDVLAEEGRKIPIPRRALSPDVFAFLQKKPDVQPPTK